MNSFVELTEHEERRVLLNVSSIRAVLDQGKDTKTQVVMRDSFSYFVNESYDEVKKRVGLPITPRAETLAIL